MENESIERANANNSNSRKRIALLLELPANRPRDEGLCLLRKLLKGLIRGYGLRCVDIREDAALAAPASTGRDEDRNTT
jgi:hypothetical protein